MIASPLTRWLVAALLLPCPWLAAPTRADEVSVAVAANFAAPMKEIAAAFATASGHQAVVSTGATGTLVAQITNGAPFEVLVSADAAAPRKLVELGLAVAGTPRTYAVGRLALWSADEGLVDAGGAVLAQGGFAHLAIANPKVAPYGVAAVEALGRLGVLAGLEPRIVQGENIGQAFQFVASGSAELGLVALSQVWKDGKFTSGSGWAVPTDLHAPLLQDAVLLAKGRDHAAAHALLAFLGGEQARAIIAAYGYELPAVATGADAAGR